MQAVLPDFLIVVAIRPLPHAVGPGPETTWQSSISRIRKPRNYKWQNEKTLFSGRP
jgi:hypothetical protein